MDNIFRMAGTLTIVLGVFSIAIWDLPRWIFLPFLIVSLILVGLGKNYHHSS